MLRFRSRSDCREDNWRNQRPRGTLLPHQGTKYGIRGIFLFPLRSPPERSGLIGRCAGPTPLAALFLLSGAQVPVPVPHPPTLKLF